MTVTPHRDIHEDSDGTAENTPINYQNFDFDFILDTPNRCNSGKLPNSNSIFLVK